MLWLWCRPAAAAPVQSLAQELPYATGGAIKKKKKKRITTIKKKEKKRWKGLKTKGLDTIKTLCILSHTDARKSHSVTLWAEDNRNCIWYFPE